VANSAINPSCYTCIPTPSFTISRARVSAETNSLQRNHWKATHSSMQSGVLSNATTAELRLHYLRNDLWDSPARSLRYDQAARR